jgi:hypothetical protein
MDQAGRIIAGMKGALGIASPQRIAFGAWKRAVGTRLALRAKPLKLVRDHLIVEVEDEIWRDSLFRLRFQILRNIEREIGTEIVSDLEFRVAPLRREPQRETGNAASVSSQPDLLADESDAIADPGLRRVYRNSRRRLSA